MQEYSLDSLKPLNASFDSQHRLEQCDVNIVNHYVHLIGCSRREDPCPGDIIEYTDEYGIYYRNAHIQAWDDEKGQFSVSCIPHVPFVFKNDEHGVRFNTGGGPWVSVDVAALKYVGKRDKLFMLFGHNGVTGNGSVYFQASVNVWEYIAPNQKHPGYSTKDWVKQYISYVEKPIDGSVYHYYGKNITFRNATELKLWKDTYKAVEFQGASPNQTILFLYREISKLVSRQEWDNLDLPLDTRHVNGIIHVKVACDDDAHMITEYRFTNSGYLDSKNFGSYERAKGTALVPPGPEVNGIK